MFKTEIKEASSANYKLVFVKVPDGLQDITVDCRDCVVRGKNNNELWTSEKIPQSIFSFEGYSHNLSDEKINKLFASESEFIQMCNYHEILYNYSAYTGKWAVLSVVN